MARKVLVINGHPDPSDERFAAALAAAYLRGASQAGHQVRRIDVASLAFAPLGSRAEFMEPPSPAVRTVQEAIEWADHVALIYPLWLGGPPAALKAFLEQVFRYGFALSPPGAPPKGLLKGRTARVIVTMGMPGSAFWLAFDAAGLRSVARGILWLSGLSPVRSTIIGGIEGPAARRAAWLARIERMGAHAK